MTFEVFPYWWLWAFPLGATTLILVMFWLTTRDDTRKRPRQDPPAS